MESKTMPAIKKYIVAANNEDADLKAQAMQEIIASFTGMNPIEEAAEIGKLKKLAKEIDSAKNKEEILAQWEQELKNTESDSISE